MNIKQELNETIKGSVYLEIIDDTIKCTIHTPVGLVYRYTITSIIWKIVQGISSQTIAQEIVKSYKHYIFSQFFVNKSLDKNNQLVYNR